MRPLIACASCRERRKKCIRRRQGMSCNFCISRGLTCNVPHQPVLRASSSRRQYGPLLVPRAADGPSPAAPAFCPESDFVDEMVDLFFRYYHVSFPNIFHPPSIRAAAKDGSMPRVLFFGIAGLAARYSHHTSIAHIPVWDRGQPYVEEAERLLDLHNQSLTSIQACILLGIAAAAQGDIRTESVYYSNAYRMAQILDLPNTPASSSLDREIHIRVWWTLLTIDTWNSAALCIPRTINWREDIPLPMDELEFQRNFKNAKGPTPSVEADKDKAKSSAENIEHAPPPFSVLGHKVKLNLLLYKVIKLNLSIVADTITSYDLQQEIQTITQSLNDWIRHLPHEWRYTKENLLRWAEADTTFLFMSVHLDYNHACQLLFFQFLYLSQEPLVGSTDSVNYPLSCQLAEKCKYHAANICQILHDAKKHLGVEPRHSLLAHVISIASATQIHTLLFSPEDGQIAAARNRLEDNFGTLLRLYKYWPNVAASFSRLEAFHLTCLQSKDNSFRLDQWMLRFILDFARPMHERIDGVNPNSDGDLWSLDRLRRMLRP